MVKVNSQSRQGDEPAEDIPTPDRRLTWRRILVGFIPVLIALVLAGASTTGIFSVVNGLFYDEVAKREAGQPPRVVIIESDDAFLDLAGDRYGDLAAKAISAGMVRMAFTFDPRIQSDAIAPDRLVIARPAKRIPGTHLWRLVSVSGTHGTQVAYMVQPPAHGIHRSQLRWLPGPNEQPIAVFESAAAGQIGGAQSYLVRLSHDQNLPRIKASQIMSGEIGSTAVKGMIAIVAPPAGLAERHLDTALGSGARALPASQFNGAAIQTLIDGRAVRLPGLLGTGLMLVTIALVLSALLMVFEPKRLILPLLLAALFAIPAGGAALIVFGNVLPPVSELLLLLLLATPLAFYHAEMDAEHRLRRFVAALVSYSSRRTLLKNEARLASFLQETAQLLGITHMLLLQRRGRSKFEVLATHEASLDDLIADRPIRDSYFREARRSGATLDAESLVPQWQGQRRIVEIGAGATDTFWIYALPESDHGAEIAEDLAANFKVFRQWRARISAAADSSLRNRRIEDWIGSAANQIANQGEQLREGMDQLETAVMIFHLLGFPLHANQEMAALFERTGLSLSDSTLPEAIAALTHLKDGQVSAILHELLHNGGETRINCRDFDARSRILRISSPKSGSATHAQRTFTLEIIDVTELRKLADLRLALANFLDSQLRNDIEAIILATGIVRDPRMTGAAQATVLEQIEKAAQRTIKRLEDLAPQALSVDGSSLSQTYPIDVCDIVDDARELVRDLARDLDVELDIEKPALSGFTIAEPQILTSMIEAILRIVIADTPKGETVKLAVRDDEAKTMVSVTGGIGTSFERLYNALEMSRQSASNAYRPIVEGMAAAVQWGAVVSYSSEVGRGYRFIISLRRIG